MWISGNGCVKNTEGSSVCQGTDSQRHGKVYHIDHNECERKLKKSDKKLTSSQVCAFGDSKLQGILLNLGHFALKKYMGQRPFLGK